MAGIEGIVEDMEAGSEIRFADLYKVCEHYFGKPRNSGSSHYIFKTPWPGDPRINIQNDRGNSKKYQVRQVLAALAKLRDIAEAAAKAAAEKKPTEIKPEKPKKPKKPKRK